MLPVLIVDLDGVKTIPPEALAFSRHIAGNNLKNARRKLRVVANLFEFWCAIGRPPLETADDVEALIYGYLFERLVPPSWTGAETDTTVEWANQGTVVADYAVIRDYASFNAGYRSFASPFGQALRHQSENFRRSSPRPHSKAFMKHLFAQRVRLHELIGMKLAFPRRLNVIARANPKPARKNTATPSAEFVDELIHRERNPVFKALWLLIAFASPRPAEALNLWLCDVLPASASIKLVGYEMHEPLVILAHPGTSTYIGDVQMGRDKLDRAGLLFRKYKTVPRTQMLQDQGLYAGWKGMEMADRQRLFSWCMWSNRERAAEFEELRLEISDIHRAFNYPASHPYFFINAINGEHRGKPQRLKNVEQAFFRASSRVTKLDGVLPTAAYSLRHFYVWRLRTQLGLPPDKIQVILRHGSIDSQEHYGKRVASAHRDLSRILG